MTKPTLPIVNVPSAGGGAVSVSIPLVPFSEGNQYMGIIVPPGGFAGFAQQTPATQALFQRAGRKGGQRSARKRRAKAKANGKAKTARKRRRTTAKRKGALVKGSAAAKRRMAAIRRKRK